MAIYGSLGDIDVGAIDKSIADTAVDIFIYDTSKDSDGGAWRHRTSHTSWYNETLNTATRGSRREFPSVAVIVAEAYKLTVYDGDDPDLPMWMVFNSPTTGVDGQLTMLGANGDAMTSVSALNGIIAVGEYTSYGGLVEIIFLSDTARRRRGSVSTNGTHGYWGSKFISTRNTGSGTVRGYDNTLNTSSDRLVADNLNDVAMTVLPNAPIDPATGLPIPTIAVATAGGVSVIKDDGSVVDITGQTEAPYRITFNRSNPNEIITSGYWTRVMKVYKIPSSDVNESTQLRYYVDSQTPKIPFGSGAMLFESTQNEELIVRVNGGTPSNGFYRIAENLESKTNGMNAHIRSDYNTGWMHGDIKGAFLSDTDDTDVTGSELITNGDSWTGASGSTPPTGWTGGNSATFDVIDPVNPPISGDDGVALRLINAGSAQGGPNSYMYTSFTTVVGQSYTLSLVNYWNSTITVGYRVGTSVNGVQNASGSWVTAYGNPTVRVIKNFVATATTTYLTLFITSGTNAYGTLWDEVSIRPSDPDRSVNNKGLAVYGTITKSAVATGADLVAYSGWTSSNYLMRPMESSDNPGSGDYSVSFWGKTGTASVKVFFSLRDPNNAAVGWIQMWYNSSNFSFGHNPGGYVTTPATYADNTWHCFVGTRKGNTLSLYQDGVLLSTVTNTNNPGLPATSQVRVGNHYDGLYAHDGELALLRYSLSAPSAEQVKKMYEDEKVLFQENAKCTLYGSSDAVTALAYDEVTERLHVGTSSGRSEFQGLRRINNTTTAVTTAISAYDSFVVEQ